MDSPYTKKKWSLQQTFRSKGAAFKEAVIAASERKTIMARISSEEHHMIGVNYDKIVYEMENWFADCGGDFLSVDATPHIKYFAASNILNTMVGGQMSTYVRYVLPNLHVPKDTRVHMDGTQGRQRLTLNTNGQMISMSEVESFDVIIKAFGWNRNEAVNQPAINRNLAALLRQCGNGFNVCTRIIKLMCYYFIAARRGRIKFAADRLDRFNIISYDYASIGNACVVDDCAFTYCSDPHNAYVYMLHAVGMSAFPANVGANMNGMYNGLTIPADAGNLRIVIPDVNEVGVPHTVEMTAETYACALNVIITDYQIGNDLVETLWTVAASLMAHSAYNSITLPKVDSLALVARPIWNPLFSVPDMVRKITVNDAVMMAYATRSTVWASVVSLVSWAMKGRHTYDGLASVLMRATTSKADRMYLYRTLQQCLPSVWGPICWLDVYRGMDRDWIDGIKGVPLLASYWVLNRELIIGEDSSYEALCHGVLLRRSEDYSSGSGQKAGATGIALGILTGTIHSASSCEVTGHGPNYALRNLLCEGPVTVTLCCVANEHWPDGFASNKFKNVYTMTLDLDREVEIPEVEDINELQSEDGDGETGEDLSQDDVLSVEPTPSRWRPRSRTRQKMVEQDSRKNIAMSRYIEGIIPKLTKRGLPIDKNHVEIRAAMKRYWRNGDKEEVDADVAIRVGLAKVFGTRCWRYVGGIRDINLVLSACTEDTGQWDDVKKLIPPLMVDFAEASLDMLFYSLQCGKITPEMSIDSKSVELWRLAYNVRKLPEFVKETNVALNSVYGEIEAILAPVRKEDIWQWLMDESIKNRW